MIRLCRCSPSSGWVYWGVTVSLPPGCHLGMVGLSFWLRAYRTYVFANGDAVSPIIYWQEGNRNISNTYLPNSQVLKTRNQGPSYLFAKLLHPCLTFVPQSNSRYINLSPTQTALYQLSLISARCRPATQQIYLTTEWVCQTMQGENKGSSPLLGGVLGDSLADTAIPRALDGLIKRTLLCCQGWTEMMTQDSCYYWECSYCRFSWHHHRC